MAVEDPPKAAAKKRAASKKPAAKSAPATSYVALERAEEESDVLAKALREGRVWIEQATVAASQGEAAIKQAFKDPVGTAVKAGTYKAVPVTNWDSDSNNLIVESEVTTVNRFRKPGR